jgi:hypothetical protein
LRGQYDDSCANQTDRVTYVLRDSELVSMRASEAMAKQAKGHQTHCEAD